MYAGYIRPSRDLITILIGAYLRSIRMHGIKVSVRNSDTDEFGGRDESEVIFVAPGGDKRSLN